MASSATANRPLLRERLRRADPLWTEREAEAWDVVRTIADDVDPGRLNSRKAFLALGTRTVEAVGETMFPGEDNPLWRLSVPEFLTFVKRVSDMLDPAVRQNIPHGNSVTVGQAMAIYQWRSVIGVTEAAYDLWHLFQHTRPVTAEAQETHEQAARELHDWERNELGRRFASAYVRAVGRAAIDLYGGRLRPPADVPAAGDAKAAEGGQTAPQEVPKPLRILVAGQVAAGKSSLISALLREIKAKVVMAPTKGLRAYELKREGVTEVVLIDTPGIEADDVAIESLKTQALHCDLLVWVTSAMSRDRGRDRRVLDALRVAVRAERRYPPVLAVHTHVDQLQPILEWTPPYNLDRAESPKAQAIGKALLAVASDLKLPIQSVVPICLDQMRGLYNIDILWARMLDVLTEGQSMRLTRALAVPGDEGHWKRLWVQATVNGRIMTRSLALQKGDPGSSRRSS
jgi:predicted GTPase